MHNFKELKVWQKSVDLVVDIYKELKNYPTEERFSLCQQMRRCVSSVPSNISEGAGRNSKKEFKYFLSVAKGSLNELQTDLIVSERLNYISKTTLDLLEQQVMEIGKMISGLMKTLD